MTTTVRSVRVEMELGVAKYVANARLVGSETDKMADRIERRVGGVNSGLGSMDAGLGKVRSAEEAVTASTTKMNDRLGETQKRTDGLGRSTEKAGPSIDKFSGRLRTLGELAVFAGPALLRLGAGALPLVSAGMVGLGATAGAVGVTALALSGVGDALKSLNTYELERTPENLAKVREEFARLGPDGAHFVQFLNDLGPQLERVRQTARAGVLPGFEDGIDNLLTRLPLVEQVVNRLSKEVGRLASDAGSALAGDDWTPFFEYVRGSAAPILDDFARSAGNVALGLANILVAFDPLTRSFSDGLENMTSDFADWSKHLEDNEGFQSFVATVQESGPELKEFLGAVVDALAGLARASAPLGQVVLPMLTAVAQAFAAIANSSIGPSLYAAAAGMIALGRASGPLKSLNTTFMDLRTSPNLAATAVQKFGGAAKLAAGGAGIGLFAASLQETNKTLSALEGAAGGALAGFALGGPWGAAVGGAIGLVVSLGRAHEDTKAEVADLTATYDAQTGAITENTRVKAAAKLQDAGLLDAASQLGIQSSQLTDYVLGNASAQTQLNSALAGYDVDHTITSVDDLKRSFSDQEIATILANRAATTLRDGLPGLTSNFSAAGAAARDIADAAGSSVGQTNALRGAFDSAAAAAGGLTDELTALDNFLNNRGTFRAYQASLDALRASLKDAPHAFSEMGAAGRENLGNLDQVITDAESHLKTLTNPEQKGTYLDSVIETLKQIGKTSPEAAAAIRKVLPELQAIKSANKEILIKVNSADAMKKAAVAKLAMRDLALQHPSPTISAQDRASGIIASVRRLLAGLDGDTATTYVKTIHTTEIRPGTSVTDPHAAIGHSADGTTVPKTGLPYADRHLYMLADGEEVVSNRHGQADRHRSLLKAINAGRRMAEGGTAGSSPFFNVGGGAGWQDLIHSTNDAASSLTRLEKAADKVQKAYDKEKTKLEAMQSAQDSLIESVAAKFAVDLGNSGTQISAEDFGIDKPSADVNVQLANVLALQGVNSSLATSTGPEAQIAAAEDRASQFPMIVRALKRAGLDGPELIQAINQMDFAHLQALAASPTAAAALEDSLSSLSSKALKAGQVTGDVTMGKDIRTQTKVVERVHDELVALNKRVDALQTEQKRTTRATEQVPEQIAEAERETAADRQRRKRGDSRG